ncbi:MAG: hypothetical protein WAK53_05195 [Chromatiaceae bacterium]
MNAPLPSLGCSPFIEEHPHSSYATFRANTDAFESCPVSEATYRHVVSEWLRSRASGWPELTSLSLGRAVSFPWVSQHIADAALETPSWAAKVAGAPPGRRDALAAGAIRDPELLHRLAVPFEGTDYVVTGISFEKVLYGSAIEHSSHKDAGATRAPFDAQLWLQLGPKR